MRDLLRTRRFVVGRTMLDVGANIGTTLIPRIVLGDFSRAYAAEADPDNFACLAANVASNHLDQVVTAEHLAISDDDGSAHLRRNPKMGNHRLLPDSDANRKTTVSVPCLTLDSWVSSLGLAPRTIDFIKVDTQGWEPRVMEGATELLSHPHIVWELEYCPLLMARAGASAERLLRLLQGHFTHFHDLRDRAPLLREIKSLDDQVSLIGTTKGAYFTNLLLLNA